MTVKLSFGYLYDFRNPRQWQRPWADRYTEILDVIAWSESLGFEGAWVPEHHGADDGYMPSPLIALAAVAARTKTIRLGTAVALAPLYHPVRFAQDCAVLDILSGGRLEIAAAIGYRKSETAALGVDFTRRGRMFDEFLEVVTRLWAGETVVFAGQHFSVEGVRLMPPTPRGQIPLYIGGFADKAMERVVKYANGYFGNPESWTGYREKLASLGKEPTSGRMRVTGLFLAVAHDPEKAMHELAPYYHHANNTYGEWANEDRSLGLEEPLKAMSLEEYKTSGELQILTPAQAIAMFTQLQERMPIEHYMMMMPPGLPAAIFAEYAAVFANEVIPAFR